MVFDRICELYSKIWDSRGTFCNQFLPFYFSIKKIILDTRLNHMPFMQSPLPMLLLVAAYLFIVQTGRKWMEHRQPLQIDRLIIAYNFAQIVVNSILVLVVSSIEEWPLAISK